MGKSLWIFDNPDPIIGSLDFGQIDEDYVAIFPGVRELSYDSYQTKIKGKLYQHGNPLNTVNKEAIMIIAGSQGKCMGAFAFIIDKKDE